MNNLSKRDALIAAVRDIAQATPDSPSELQPQHIMNLILASHNALKQGSGLMWDEVEECVAIGMGTAEEMNDLAKLNKYLADIEDDKENVLSKLRQLEGLRESAENQRAELIKKQNS